jgi:hypothetical protein
MKTLPRAFRLFIVLVTLLYSGCTITLGPLDESGEDEPRTTSVSPAPEQPQGEEPGLDEAQQARMAEAERYVAEVIYQGAPIVRTVQLPSGDIIDGIDRAWLPALPYELPPLPLPRPDFWPRPTYETRRTTTSSGSGWNRRTAPTPS